MRARLRWEVALVLAGLMLVGIARWRRVLFGVEAWVAEDFPVMNLPLRAYLGEGLRQNRLVLWTPLLQCGFPLFAESQAGATSPLRWLHALPLAPWVVLAWTTVGHLAWAGAGLYAYLRLLGVRYEGALLAAVGLAFSPFLVVRHQHTNVLEAIAWWPWLLTGIEYSLRNRRFGPWLWTGGAAGLMAMGGHVQYVAYGALLAAGYLIARCWGGAARPGRWAWPAAAALVAAGLYAAQALPLAELVGHSIRAGGVGRWEETSAALSPQHLPFFVAPGFWGPIFEPGFERPSLAWEFMAYLGWLPLLLAAIGIRRRDRLAMWWVAVGLLGIVGALGDATPLYRLFSLLPGASSFRVAARMLSWYGLAVAVLAGLGAEEVLAGRWALPRGRGWLLAGATALWLAAVALVPQLAEAVVAGAGAHARSALLLSGLFAALSIAWLVTARRGGVGRWGAALVALDVLVSGAAFTPSRAGIYDRPPAPRLERLDVGPTREPDLFWHRPDTNLLVGEANVHNMSPLSLRRYVDLYDRAAKDASGADRRRVNQLLGVGWSPRPSGDRISLAPTSLTPLPAAWSAGYLDAVGDEPTMIEHTLASGPEPAVIVLAPGERAPAVSGYATVAPAAQTPNRSIYRAEGFGGDAYVVLNETAYPGRRVRVDGRAVRWRRTNGVQIGLSLAPGAHTIVVALESTTIRLGRFLTLLTLAALSAAVGIERRR